tara:strand:- start:2043 stop:2579 length:537 start_codon:yes stop_codon:yes gene_type:complete
MENITFDEEKYLLLLNLNKAQVQVSDSIEREARENGFQKKDEVHVTLIGFRVGSEIRGALTKLGDSRKRAIAEIKELIERTNWDFELKQEFYHITKEYSLPRGQGGQDKRESYVQMIEMPGIKSFYQELNNILGTNLEIQPTHVTLFTKGSDEERSKMGIGVNSWKEFELLSPRQIEL